MATIILVSRVSRKTIKKTAVQYQYIEREGEMKDDVSVLTWNSKDVRHDDRRKQRRRRCQ